MKIRLWGTRGSIPAPGPSTLRYGGNTSCVEVRLDDGTLIILDSGTGIRPLGATLGACTATLLISHYHWDHIQGLPFFAPAYLNDSAIRVIGPEFEGQGPEEYLGAQMLTPFFPAPPSQLCGVKWFDAVPSNPFSIGSAKVRAGRVSHPGITYGYRIEADGAVFVYMSDDEPAVAPADIQAEMVDLACRADLLLHDCQFTDAEYACRRYWGHSTPGQAVGFARDAGARRMILFHHDPGHTDEQIEELAEEAQRLAGDIEILIGREGETYTETRAIMRKT
jgi:phosphoribosyl 1,2-cyclic phosphodiesterase